MLDKNTDYADFFSQKTIANHLHELIAGYKFIADHIGVSYPQLAKDWKPEEHPVFNYSIQNQDGEEIKKENKEALKNATEKVMNFRIHGPLDPFWGVTARSIIRDVEYVNPTQIIATIDSPGGSVWEGMSLYHFLSSHKADVTTINGALVASAAVLPFLSGKVREMGQGTSLMTHAPNIGVVLSGEYDEIKKRADNILNRLEHGLNAMVSVYADVLALTELSAKKYFKGENWFTANQALDEGFSTEKPKDNVKNMMDDEENLEAVKNLTQFHIGILRDQFMGKNK